MFAKALLVEAIAVGVCGTDVEIIEGKYGWAPPGKTRLILGHESLGRDRSWLDRLITRRERPENFASALHRRADDIKVVVQFAEA